MPTFLVSLTFSCCVYLNSKISNTEYYIQSLKIGNYVSYYNQNLPTSKRVISSVLQKMQNLEMFSNTHITFKRLSWCVASYGYDIVRLLEFLITKSTFVWPLTGINSHVILQISILCKRFSTFLENDIGLLWSCVKHGILLTEHINGFWSRMPTLMKF
jgi:hypothetical protein